MATKNTKIPSKAMQKRIMKTGEVSDADVELYIKQVGIDTLQSMSLTPENIKEYLKNITELGNPQSKKKLPSKKKIQSSDSVLVVDGSDTISKVASKDADLSIKSLSKKAGEGVLDLGSAAFNKMFPNVGKFMTWAQNKLAKQDKNAAESNSSIQGYSREVSKSSSLLDNIIESQNRTNSILLKILNAAGTRAPAPAATPAPAPAPAATPAPAPAATPAPAPAPAPAATPTPAPAARPATATTPAPAARPATATTPATAAANRTATGGANLTRNSTIAAGAATAATIGTGAALMSSASATGSETAPTSEASSAPVATQTRAELTPVQQRMITNYLRSKSLQEDTEAKEIVENIVRQIRPSGITEIDERVLDSNYTRIRIGQSPVGMLIAHQPVILGRPFTDNQIRAIEAGIQMNGRQKYPAAVLDQYDRQKSGLAITTPAATAAPETTPTITAATSVATATPTTTAAPTTTAPTPVAAATPTGFDARLLHIKAKEIIFKADKFEYSQETPAAATPVAPSGGGGGVNNAPAAPSAPPPAPMSLPAAPSAGVAPASGAPGATPAGAANLSGLEFAAGVDQRINPGVADKAKEVQSAFGRKLVVTSGFRDPARNTRAGGASGSKHLTSDAVDVQFPGNEQDTINLIKVASEKGMGGIGVYRPGFLHLDTGSKRVWGPDYTAKTIPQWAKPALDEHMGRPAAPAAVGGAAGGGGAAAGGETASPIASAASAAAPASQATPSPSAPSSPPAAVATPAPAAPSSGVSVSRASVADEASTRVAPTPSTPSPGGSAPSAPPQANPSLPSIDPNNPGEVEPPDAAERYARLFNMAA